MKSETELDISSLHIYSKFRAILLGVYFIYLPAI